MFVPFVITLLGICDCQPEREADCPEKPDVHGKLFFTPLMSKEAEMHTTEEKWILRPNCGAKTQEGNTSFATYPLCIGNLPGNL